MQTHGGPDDPHQRPRPPFSIIEEFAMLQGGRKLFLCRQLFGEGSMKFQNTVRVLWPHAMASDVRKLESFLMLLRHSVPKKSKYS